MAITAIVQPNVYEDGNIHGAEIADPYNNVLAIASSEDEQPYRAALEDVGLTVIGTDSSGDWVLSQSRPL